MHLDSSGETNILEKYFEKCSHTCTKERHLVWSKVEARVLRSGRRTALFSASDAASDAVFGASDAVLAEGLSLDLHRTLQE